MLNAKALGVATEGKILLKTVHVWIGYVFAINLLWRVVWAFIGGQYVRWQAIFPGGQNYVSEVREYIADFKAGRPRQYLGHNPLGRIAVTLLLCLLLVQAITGLVLAGTDIFYPPIGSWITSWIANPGVDPASLVPYAKEMYDPVAYDAMRAFRKPFITIHYYGLYVLLGLALIHILAVVITELREGGNLISAMFSGKKTLSETPADKKNRLKRYNLAWPGNLSYSTMLLISLFFCPYLRKHFQTSRCPDHLGVFVLWQQYIEFFPIYKPIFIYLYHIRGKGPPLSALA